jgi:hypothetical protein
MEKKDKIHLPSSAFENWLVFKVNTQCRFSLRLPTNERTNEHLIVSPKYQELTCQRGNAFISNALKDLSKVMLSNLSAMEMTQGLAFCPKLPYQVDS